VRRLQPTFSFEADAPASVELTLFAQPDRRRHVLSVVNFQRDMPNLPVDGVAVRLRLPEVRHVRQLPDGRKIPHRVREGVLTFRLPRLRTLAMFALSWA